MFQLHLKRALTNETEILQNFIIDWYVNSCDYNFIYLLSIFVLMVMSLKTLLTSSYVEKTYKHTVNLKKMKSKASIAKNQLIFLGRCIKNNILPKSFCLRTTD